MAPKVSVIVPVYNTAQYLPECLDSILSQTLKDIEIIAINDGSPDNSIDILKEYAAKDERLKIIDKKNEGVGKARNDGIRAAEGEFIAFMDSDDYYPTPQVLEKLVSAARGKGVKVAGGRKVKLEDGRAEKDKKIEDCGMDFTLTGLHSYSEFQYDYGYWQYIYERPMLVENDIFFPPYKRFQDPPFFVKAMIRADQFFVLDEPSYVYRVIPSANKISAARTLDFFAGLSDNLKISREYGLSKLHYLCAKRIDTDGTYMALNNLNTDNNDEILGALLRTSSLIDSAWLRDEGYDVSDPFVPEAVRFCANTTARYQSMRKSKLFRVAAKLAEK